MSGNNEQKDTSEVMVIGGEKLPDTSRLQPKHFDILESVLTQLYRHQYRHVSHVGGVELTLWICGTLLLAYIEFAYLESYGLREVAGKMVTVFIASGFFIGFLSFLSKCFTRLAHFRINTLRFCHFMVGVELLDLLNPWAMGLSSFIGGVETIWLLIRYSVVVFLLYRACTALMSFKQLRYATIGFLVIALLVPALLFAAVDNFRHYVLGDNEVVVYSDYGARRSQKIEAVDAMVDEAIAGLD